MSKPPAVLWITVCAFPYLDQPPERGVHQNHPKTLEILLYIIYYLPFANYIIKGVVAEWLTRQT
jgi:hypothetical protein